MLLSGPQATRGWLVLTYKLTFRFILNPSLPIIRSMTAMYSLNNLTRPRFLLLIVVLLLIAGSASGEIMCHQCGYIIDGAYVRAEGHYYHPEHFACGHCGRTIDGDYIVYEDKNYHGSCYRMNVALRCSLCDQIINGTYIQDYWGNNYCKFHEGQNKQCEYCHRFISEELTGGAVTYNDGRHVCRICQNSAVTDEDDIQEYMEKVADVMSDYGIDVDLDKLDLHMVDIKEMQKRTGQKYHTLQGYADYREHSGLFGLIKDEDVSIYVLWGMPEADVVATLAHELTHIWPPHIWC
jgi:hypothetical protein